jgi:hypothetical protein
MLGPVHTAIYTMGDKFPRWMAWLKHAFSGSLDGSARAIARFARTRRAKLFYPWRAIPLYLGMWSLLLLLPGFFRGRVTLAGNARRRSEPGTSPEQFR